MASRPGQRDLTAGPIGKTLLAFAIPTLVSSILQSLNGSINAIWVGRFLGEEALASTSNANLVMFLLMAFVFGFGMAATVLIGQAFGRRDIDGARRVIGTAIGGFLPVAAAIGDRSAGSSRRRCSTCSPCRADALPLALAYLRVIFLAMPRDPDHDRADDGPARLRRRADPALVHDRRGACSTPASTRSSSSASARRRRSASPARRPRP